MKVAAIDLGTNTFLLLVAEVMGGRIDRVLHDEARVIRLGQGVNQTKRLHPEALARAKECFAEFAHTIQKLGVDKVRAVATSAARDVENGSELIALGADFGIPIDIIPGEMEAELTFWGTFREDPKGPAVIVDTGGGSTEYILGGPDGIEERISLDIGSVRMTEMFVTRHPIPSAEMTKMTNFIRDQVSVLRGKFSVSGKNLVAVAGTPTTLAAIDQGRAFESDLVDGHVLTLERLGEFVDTMVKMSVEERQKLAGMEPKRADVIVAGALILKSSCEALGATGLEVSVRGLRYGLARKLGGLAT
ncbi:MAG: Ppx/GppA phosphatase family protein [Bdellovibrionota bacterium]